DGQNDARAAKPFGDPRCRESDHAAVPILSGDDDKARIRPQARFKQCGLRHIFLDLSALAISRIQQRREPSCLGKILGCKKLDDMLCNVHWPGGIYSWADTTTAVVARHLRSAIRDLHKRFQAEISRISQVAKT